VSYSNEDKLIVVALRNAGVPFKQITEMTGLSLSTVRRAVDNYQAVLIPRNAQNPTSTLSVVKERGRPRNDKLHMKVFTLDEEGYSPKEIAAQTGYTTRHVYHILNNCQDILEVE